MYKKSGLGLFILINFPSISYLKSPLMENL